MKYSFWRKVCWLAAGFILLVSVQAFGQSVEVYQILDGDTIKVLNRGEIEKIRFYGIDTPESSQKGGKAATEFVRGLISPGQQISVQITGVGVHGRSIGIVTIPNTGIILNQALIEAGHAWVYRRYCKKPFCTDWANFESAARGNRAGLWSDPDPQSPWEYRRMFK